MKPYRPRTPSRRHMTVVGYSSLTAREPLKPLTRRLPARAGRNSQGRITMRHQGGGNKALYRAVDFRMNKAGVPARVEAIEYDPYRTAFIARLLYRDGERRYALASQGLAVGDVVAMGEEAPAKPGNRTSLQRIPVGAFVYNVELSPGRGGQIARSAGSSVQVLANEDGYTHLKMPSGEVRKVPWSGYASIGQVSNPEHKFVTIGKAGRSRWLGVRPTVRAKAMNPRDHKYGGGEGSTQRGTKRPKDKWGNITGGRRTRSKKKWSSKLIMKRRK
ncbi:50S ribosomal protein L2 [Candidatus Jorgensenbacteria bacterium CG10_big_fil_rev_8_21_14_0_10_54_38]|uniref:Large ribosomal subunit protein uL2 n=2 Tax=Candidatus Joergenseniibacteriota TaxID=1752739 RepID=A0A2M6WGD5_9BACT|nr:MAG: 50S ribosomal protein L2 [Candidatus Jorgensenbacteria bacterium CG23_combo_of_CG06-09_8_20_14_all_54_14]PIT91825.1 MAG: 50S ribosomal protein L2 [Candidatus Jorgensenbacteria bacterium CG10_big_fil_rev_8_21_14_0_10_54_38]